MQSETGGADILAEKGGQLVEGDQFYPVVKIDMPVTWNDEQFFWFGGTFVCFLTERHAVQAKHAKLGIGKETRVAPIVRASGLIGVECSEISTFGNGADRRNARRIWKRLLFAVEMPSGTPIVASLLSVPVAKAIAFI